MELSVTSSAPIILNRLPCAVDNDANGTEVDMTWFDLTKRTIKDKNGQERTLAQYQGRPLLETRFDMGKLNLVLVQQEGDFSIIRHEKTLFQF